MILYIKLGTVRAICLEIKKDFGSKPFFQKNTFHYETIIDIPYGQIIYTSGKWQPSQKRVKKTKLADKNDNNIFLRSASNVNEETGKARKCSQRTHNG